MRVYTSGHMAREPWGAPGSREDIWSAGGWEGSPAALLLLLPNKQAPSAPGVICPPKGQKAGSMGMGAPASWLEDELPISTSFPAGPAGAPGCGAWSLSMPLSGALLNPSLPLAVSQGPPQRPPASGQAPASSLPSLPSRTLLLGPPSSLLWPKASCQVLCGVTSRVPAGRWGLPHSWALSQDSWVDLAHPHSLL